MDRTANVRRFLRPLATCPVLYCTILLLVDVYQIGYAKEVISGTRVVGSRFKRVLLNDLDGEPRLNFTTNTSNPFFRHNATC
jgi:hypothetical protein